MSDAVTNTEVEDVLSSIRRLVSEDKRPTTDAKAATGSDRLVLTPALRVAEAPVDTAQGDEDADTAAEHPETSEPETADAPVSDASDEDDAPDAAILAMMAATAPDAASDEAAEASEPAVGDDAPQDDELQMDAPSGDSDTAAQDATDQDGSDDAEMSAQHDDVAPDATDEARPDEAEDDGPVHPDPAPQISDTQATKAHTLSAKIAVLEEVIARTDDQWEPDGTGTDDYAGTDAPAMAWQDVADDADADEPVAAAAPPPPRPEPREAPRPAAPAPEIFASDEDVLDEEALRDLVATIVREELQGALGERITRNVRKLVRREIHRALAAQELE